MDRRGHYLNSYFIAIRSIQIVVFTENHINMQCYHAYSLKCWFLPQKRFQKSKSFTSLVSKVVIGAKVIGSM